MRKIEEYKNYCYYSEDQPQTEETMNSPQEARLNKLKICSTCACYLYNKNTEPCKDCDGFYNNRWRSIK